MASVSVAEEEAVRPRHSPAANEVSVVSGYQGASGFPLAVEQEEEDDSFYDCSEIPEHGASKEDSVAGADPWDKDSGEPLGSRTGHGLEDVTERAGVEQEDSKEPAGAKPGQEVSGKHETTEPGQEASVTGDSGQNETELEEEFLLELEKELTEEERQRRQEESTTLKGKGNEQFKKGEYTEADALYTQALQICPACFRKERSILFSNRGAARLKQDKMDSAIADCSKAIELNPDYIRAILRRAELYEKTEKLDEALADYKSVLERDPSVPQAREACMRLPRQIEERNERLKEEMLGKLKDLGNLVLRPFGLSTANFQINKDSTSGSYSVNFVQNPNNNNR
ncbi:tetratricopeptide repeat protein 1 [Microcaecilia unicolor]|uniref:Tetratricopeptide repeat protein 1 n=1 Tax=Microcaecilia unicolor TaxID=1415580 RepID=A0A6P7YU97_9AMPH|nr:tetratricopeptide repeat protein 1 [Microcaecilia unicolor]